ncbi:hypothetical protein QL285_073224 [Trifolium repens]|nr:hypothetical protein QL285_073224 [Trifolium repens]
MKAFIDHPTTPTTFSVKLKGEFNSIYTFTIHLTHSPVGLKGSIYFISSSALLSASAMGGGVQALKRIPRIKFPNRRSNSSEMEYIVLFVHSLRISEKREVLRLTQSLSSATETNLPFFSSSNTSTSLGGKASLQPKRTHVTNDEIEAVLLGGCF